MHKQPDLCASENEPTGCTDAAIDRLRLVAEILAQGVIRLHQRTALHGVQNSGQKGLEVPGETVLSVHTGYSARRNPPCGLRPERLSFTSPNTQLVEPTSPPGTSWLNGSISFEVTARQSTSRTACP